MIRRPVLVVVAVQSRRETVLWTRCVLWLRMVPQVQGDHSGGEPGMDPRTEEDDRNPLPAPSEHFRQYGERARRGQTPRVASEPDLRLEREGARGGLCAPRASAPVGGELEVVTTDEVDLPR